LISLEFEEDLISYLIFNFWKSTVNFSKLSQIPQRQDISKKPSKLSGKSVDDGLIGLKREGGMAQTAASISRQYKKCKGMDNQMVRIVLSGTLFLVSSKFKSTSVDGSSMMASYSSRYYYGIKSNWWKSFSYCCSSSLAIGDQQNKPDTAATMSEAFSSLINYCESVKFKGFEYPTKPWQMCSFDETKAFQVSKSILLPKNVFKQNYSFFIKLSSMSKSSAEKFIKLNSTHLSRIYPRGSRVMSSNYDPIPLWRAGCQLIALNFQADDRPLMLNRAMFKQNGGCGYVLKPKILRHDFPAGCTKG